MIAVFLVGRHVDYLSRPVAVAILARLQAEMSAHHESLVTADGGVPQRIEHYNIDACIVLRVVFRFLAFDRREINLHDFLLACFNEICFDVGISLEQLEDVPDRQVSNARLCHVAALHV